MENSEKNSVKTSSTSASPLSVASSLSYEEDAIACLQCLSPSREGSSKLDPRSAIQGKRNIIQAQIGELNNSTAKDIAPFMS